MKTTAGLWIDHRKALISIVSDTGEETLEIRSNVERQAGRIDGERSTAPYEEQLVKADDSRQRAFTGHLNQYYDRVIAAVRNADAILIFGPGEAKGELRKRLTHEHVSGAVLEMETTDKMTDNQVAAKVREHFRG